MQLLSSAPLGLVHFRELFLFRDCLRLVVYTSRDATQKLFENRRPRSDA